MNAIHGDKVNCDMCGKEYKFFVWALGSDKNLCRVCVQKVRSAFDNIDDMEFEDPFSKDYEEGNTDRLEVKTNKPDRPVAHPRHHLTYGTRS